MPSDFSLGHSSKTVLAKTHISNPMGFSLLILSDLCAVLNALEDPFLEHSPFWLHNTCSPDSLLLLSFYFSIFFSGSSSDV